MKFSYNQIAGQNAERLAALSDSIFAVAMTLLLLDVRVPAGDLHREADLRHALAAFSPQLVVYLMSFITLGIFWVGQQTQPAGALRPRTHQDPRGVSVCGDAHVVPNALAE